VRALAFAVCIKVVNDFIKEAEAAKKLSDAEHIHSIIRKYCKATKDLKAERFVRGRLTMPPSRWYPLALRLRLPAVLVHRWQGNQRHRYSAHGIGPHVPVHASGEGVRKT